MTEAEEIIELRKQLAAKDGSIAALEAQNKAIEKVAADSKAEAEGLKTQMAEAHSTIETYKKDARKKLEEEVHALEVTKKAKAPYKCEGKSDMELHAYMEAFVNMSDTVTKPKSNAPAIPHSTEGDKPKTKTVLGGLI